MEYGGDVVFVVMEDLVFASMNKMERIAWLFSVVFKIRGAQNRPSLNIIAA